MSEIAWLSETQSSDPGRVWTCDWCGAKEDADGPPPIMLTGVGWFCSPACADKASVHHADVLDPRR